MIGICLSSCSVVKHSVTGITKQASVGITSYTVNCPERSEPVDCALYILDLKGDTVLVEPGVKYKIGRNALFYLKTPFGSFTDRHIWRFMRNKKRVSIHFILYKGREAFLEVYKDAWHREWSSMPQHGSAGYNRITITDR